MNAGTHPASRQEGRAGTVPGLAPHLRWLVSVLWSAEGVHASLDGRLPPGVREVETYLALPDAARARLLVPLSSRAAADRALWQFNDSMTQAARLRKVAAGLALRAGVLQRTGRARITVGVAAGAERSALLEERIRELLGRPDAVAAITIGPVRPNRKPVILALGPDGAPLAYVKLAWNPLTRALVQREAETLAAWSLRPPSSFSVPRLLHHGPWGGEEIALLSPLPHRLRRRGRLRQAPPPEVLEEIVTADSPLVEALAESRYLEEMRDRAARLGPEGEQAGAALERIGRVHGRAEVSFGAWHGDWAPWNMSTVGGRLHVWDWERSRTGIPVGFDAIHFAFQVAFQFGGKDVDVAAERCLRDGRRGLRDLGVEPDLDAMLLDLYLLELALRYLEARAGGATDNDERVIGALLGRATAGASKGER